MSIRKFGCAALLAGFWLTMGAHAEESEFGACQDACTATEEVCMESCAGGEAPDPTCRTNNQAKCFETSQSTGSVTIPELPIHNTRRVSHTRAIRPIQGSATIRATKAAPVRVANAT